MSPESTHSRPPRSILAGRQFGRTSHPLLQGPAVMLHLLGFGFRGFLRVDLIWGFAWQQVAASISCYVLGSAVFHLWRLHQSLCMCSTPATCVDCTVGQADLHAVCLRCVNTRTCLCGVLAWQAEQRQLGCVGTTSCLSFALAIGSCTAPGHVALATVCSSTTPSAHSYWPLKLKPLAGNWLLPEAQWGSCASACLGGFCAVLCCAVWLVGEWVSTQGVVLPTCRTKRPLPTSLAYVAVGGCGHTCRQLKQAAWHRWHFRETLAAVCLINFGRQLPCSPRPEG